MERVYVGDSFIGAERYEVFLCPGDGATVDTAPDDKGPPEVNIGADVLSIADLLVEVLHESVEMAMHRDCCGYTGSFAVTQDSGSYTFVMNHAQFTEIIYKAGYFLAAIENDLLKSWKEWKKPKKSRRKKS
jgi:hypothetical protein